MTSRARAGAPPPPLRARACGIAAATALLLAGSLTVRYCPEATAAPVTPQSPPSVGELVVKTTAGASIERISASIGATVSSTILASRSIYLLDVPLPSPEPNTPPKKRHPKQADPKRARSVWKAISAELVRRLEQDPEVRYAEANTETDSTEGERFHYWPNGGPECIGRDGSAYSGQPAVEELHLTDVHRVAGGDGALIAILDTGISLRHPALSGRIDPGGYDYVDDDADPRERRNGVDDDQDGRVDEGYGHGTFVAGLAALVAPGARILPQRVLDSEGHGNAFVVAEAVFDAMAAGADVINLSFGTAEHLHSKVLEEALKSATKARVVVVAAAGNDGTGTTHYPAGYKGVLSVAATNSTGTALAAFSSRGRWVDVAAPGTDLVGPLPCGYGVWSGTSMAAPLVSGGAALLISHLGEHKATTDHLDRTLTSSCRKVRGLTIKSEGVFDPFRMLSR